MISFRSWSWATEKVEDSSDWRVRLSCFHLYSPGPITTPVRLAGSPCLYEMRTGNGGARVELGRQFGPDNSCSLAASACPAIYLLNLLIQVGLAFFVGSLFSITVGGLEYWQVHAQMARNMGIAQSGRSVLITLALSNLKSCILISMVPLI